MKQRLFLPLLTYPDASTETMLSNAVDLARNLDATLCSTVIDIAVPPIVNPWPVFIDTDEMVREAQRRSFEQGEALISALRKKCSEATVVLEIKTVTIAQPDAFEFAAEQARLFDMTLTQSGGPFATFTEGLIFGTGRPVILFPDRICAGRFDHVAIAWDGSRAAARALADATFFVDRADKVTVICVVDEKPVEKDAAKHLAEALSLRGLNATAYPFEAAGRLAGEAIQSKSLELGADLLVIGGYGHSRLREFVLGGATSDVLSNTLLPVLMSH